MYVHMYVFDAFHTSLLSLHMIFKEWYLQNTISL